MEKKIAKKDSKVQSLENNLREAKQKSLQLSALHGGVQKTRSGRRSA